ncbi:MAG: deoxyribose-phosphate aldolase [bacterium]
MENLNQFIEHTFLSPTGTVNDVEKVVNEAIENNFLGVCINPVYVDYVSKKLKPYGIKVITVVGFPLGANLPEVKSFEAFKAVDDGADEVDMVINIGKLKQKDYKAVTEDIKIVVECSKERPVKVILEVDFLTEDEVVEACKCCIEGGAKFVKTSTGFAKGGVGATAKIVKLMKDTVSAHGLEVKASGGVKTTEDAINMIKAGATRIGTSSGVSIVKGLEDTKSDY